MSKRVKTGRLARGVAIIGVGCSAFGNVVSDPRIKGWTWRELWTSAVNEALQSTQLGPKDVDMFLLGNFLGMDMLNHGCKYGAASYWAGMDLVPGVELNAACATTNVGLQLAAGMVGSGLRDIVVVSGVEILNSRIKDLNPVERTADPSFMHFRTSCAYDPAYVHSAGIVPGLNALSNLAYAREFGLPVSLIENANCHLAEYQRELAAKNPKAFHYGARTYREMGAQHGFASGQDYLKSEFNPYVQWPMRSSDNAVAADGATAYVVAPAEMAAELCEQPVDVIGMGSSSHLPTFVDNFRSPHDVEAFRQAYEMSGIKGEDLDGLSVHDAFTCNAYLVGEVGGYFLPGEGIRAVLDGRTMPDGDKPLSTTGGRAGFGHSWTASGGAEVYEAVKQMRGEAVTPLASRPELYAVHSLGGGELASVMILKARG